MYEMLLEKYQQGHFSEVISIASSSNISPANDPRSAHVFAAALFSLGQVQDAVEILADLESSLSDDDSYLSLYGAALRRCGDLEASKNLFLRAITLAPDNPTLNNNYANLLIDMKQYSDAIDILQNIVDSYPNYIDATTNLSRARALHAQGLSTASNDIPVNSNEESIDIAQLDVLLDPLLMAFDAQEVKEHGRLQSLPELKTLSDDPDLKSIGIEKLKLAQKSVTEGNASFSLELCSQAYKQLGCESSVFECASDAYISMNRFLEAELSILHSLAFSGSSMKHYINLVSLASMRCDFQLAEFYLEKAVCLDSSNSNLPKLRNLLDKRKSAMADSCFLFQKKWRTETLTQESN